MRAAYFDCLAGASGDMILGALLDGGLSLQELTRELCQVPLPRYELKAQPARRGIISGTQVFVTVGEEPRLSLEEALSLLKGAPLPPLVREQATLIFQRLAAAEARIHGIPPEQAPFHEVGAVDALVDILGSVLGLHLLGVKRVYASPLPGGGGTVTSGDHGVIPIPAPATLELIAEAGATIRPTRLSGHPQVELVTPTGAAILTTLASFSEPAMVLNRVGYGVGSRDTPEMPNVLALWLGETVEQEEGVLYLLETNIDDASPEILGYVSEQLLAAGARDAWFTPIQMKKNRPATMLSALVGAEAKASALQILLRETSTLGVRVQPIQRHEAEREEVRISSSLGQASVKVKRMGGVVVGVSPEYEDCRRLALEHGLPLQEVFRRVEREARDYLGS
jgi:hypothetical protein